MTALLATATPAGRVLPVNGRRYAAWDEAKHPRHDKGSDKGGEFAPVSGGEGKKNSSRSTEEVERLATVFVDLHNKASVEYRAAFKEVGAKMWGRDEAHPLKAAQQIHIAGILKGGMPLSVYNIRRPLTVLDSYPNVTAKQRDKLNAKVDEIWYRYQREWLKAQKKVTVLTSAGRVLAYADTTGRVHRTDQKDDRPPLTDEQFAALLKRYDE